MHPQLISELRQRLLSQLPSFLTAQRWFGGKARRIVSVDIVDAIPIRGTEPKSIILTAAVNYEEGRGETYSIPILTVAHGGLVEDAFSRPEFLAELLDIIKEERDLAGDGGGLCGCRGASFAELVGLSEAVKPKLLTGEQSNSSVIYGERLILKFFRRIEEGENPDLEIGRFLSERARFPHIARIAGWIEYRPQHGKAATQALLQEFVPNQGDAWRYTLRTLTPFYQKVRATPGPELFTSREPVEFAGESMGKLLSEIGLLGKRTAELHLALTSDHDDPAFAPEPFTNEFQKKLEASFAELIGGTLQLLRERLATVPVEYKEHAAEIASREQEIARIFCDALRAPIAAARTRIHGDYHLGQVLYTGSDFVIIDFEGEPARPLTERRVKQSPLHDVAGMLRSFHYAAFAPLLAGSTETSISQGQNKPLRRWAEAWSFSATSRFLAQYYETSGAVHYLPASLLQRTKLLEVYVLAKAIYELDYELNNRPTWVGIPLEGISRLLPR